MHLYHWPHSVLSEYFFTYVTGTQYLGKMSLEAVLRADQTYS